MSLIIFVTIGLIYKVKHSNDELRATPPPPPPPPLPTPLPEGDAAGLLTDFKGYYS